MTSNPVYILGISAYYHDSAACMLKDGELLAAASEERFTRNKHDDNFPLNAVKYCLKEAGVMLEDLDYVVFYEKPLLKFERLLMTYIQNWPFGFRSFTKSMRTWLGNKLWTSNNIQKELGKILGKKKKYKKGILFVPHHISHAASTYYPSGFEEAAVLTVDAVGEYSTASYGIGRKNKLEISHELRFPHSLGLFYSAFTYYLGFKVNSAEYKVMGLAPYGEPKYAEKMKELIKIFPDGSIELNMKYFCYEHALTMTSGRMERFFGKPRRKEDDPLEQFHKNVAASLQKVTEEIVLKMADHVRKQYDTKNICLAGGVALNCVANGRLLREGKFKNIFVFPAAGDAGGAVGAAYFLHHQILGNEERHPFKTPYLGPGFNRNKIESLLEKSGIPYKTYQDDELFTEIANLIDNNQIIGLFQGRMEFGPRALGNRSIIADARKKENWQRVNLKIKFRESFRPFAPTVMEDKLSQIYDIDVPTPYMLMTAQTKVKDIPATTHVDESARIQSVSREQNPRYYGIIEKFYQKTGCPVIINTSFNVRGEPIVCTPEDAIKCFIRTEMDILVLENFVVHASEVDKNKLKEIFTLEVFHND